MLRTRMPSGSDDRVADIEHDEQRNRARAEPEQHDPQHMHVLLVGGEREDDCARKRQIEHESLRHAVIVVAEYVKMLERIDADDDEQ